jgi:hypothetical protein
LKKLLSILLILVFLVQSTSHLWILVSFKINQEYIAANLCINRFESIPVCKGSCVLEDQLNLAQKQEQKYPDLKLKKVNLFCKHSISDLLTYTPFLSGSIPYESVSNAFYSTGYICSVFRPPSFFA